MVSVELREELQVIDTAPEELNSTSVQQVTDILDEAEQVSAKQPETKHWYYSMPFAGVRYYSF